MSADLRIRQARIDDADGIVAAIRDGFEPALLGLFIYGCAGIGRFVREQIAVRQAGCDTAYTVASRGDRVAGCVEMRRLRDELFLNYISVLSEFRSRDLGKSLLAAAIDDAREPVHARMSLDVLDGNARARRWYESLGFRCGRSTGWWDIPLPDSGGGPPCAVVGFPQSQASHREFGFSMFRIVTEAGDHAIGRLGDRWFRIAGPGALADPAVPPALLRLDPSRRILALLPEDADVPSPPPRGRRLAVTRRMSADLDGLRDRLPR